MRSRFTPSTQTGATDLRSNGAHAKATPRRRLRPCYPGKRPTAIHDRLPVPAEPSSNRTWSARSGGAEARRLKDCRLSERSLGASIIDPHGDYLADARAKLQALAKVAEVHGDHFVRIESVAKGDDGSLRVLDFTDPQVRDAVLAFEGGKVTALYQSEIARPFE